MLITGLIFPTTAAATVFRVLRVLRVSRDADGIVRLVAQNRLEKLTIVMNYKR